MTKEDVKKKAKGGSGIVALLITIIGASGAYFEKEAIVERAKEADTARVAGAVELQRALTGAVDELETTNVDLRIRLAELDVKVGALERAVEREQDLSTLMLEEAYAYEEEETGTASPRVTDPPAAYGWSPEPIAQDIEVKSVASRVVRSRKGDSKASEQLKQLSTPTSVYK